MDLDRLWQWDKRKLACRIRQETGNPAADDLRERLAELAGVNLKDLLDEMKPTCEWECRCVLHPHCETTL